MSLVIKKVKVAALAASVAIGISLPATSYGDPLKEVFNLVTTTGTGSSSYNSQSRNGVAFGTFSARFNMYEPKIVNFTPPSMSVGCGGIDIFGGAIDLISGEELVQMGRQIAAGAAVYAFNLAVESICPSCATTMSWIQDKLDQLNKFAKTSCQDVVGALSEAKVGEDQAAWLRDKAMQANWDARGSSFAQTLKEAPSNWMDLFKDNSKTGNPLDTKEAGVTGNLIWNALGEAGADDWKFAAGFNPQEMQELMMSLTGTLVVWFSDDNKKNEEDMTWQPYGPTISVSDLIWAEKGTKLKMRKCDPNEEKVDGRLICTKLLGGKQGVEVEWTGLYPRILELLIGADGDRADGIARRIISKRQLTSAQQSLVENASVPIVNQLFYIGKDPDAQDTASTLIASQVAFEFVDEMVRHFERMLVEVEIAEAANQETNAKRKEFIEAQISRLYAQRKEAKARQDIAVEAAGKLFGVLDYIVENTKK